MTIAFTSSDAHVSERMKRQRTKDTALEIAVRRILHRAGLRYRVHYPVPGIPRRSIDIAFTGPKIAVFIDGCFWHGCTLHKNIPANNHTAWERKISSNRERDRHSEQHLITAGWTVMRFWEHVAAPEIAAEIIVAVRKGLPSVKPAVRRGG
ncbi:MAG TPA: very short patch repair endonuclease [Longimicrobium sp.]|nr:very short patch repair endonuclease [Longimicrobium sp.]